MCCLNADELHAKAPKYKWKFATLAPDGVGWSMCVKENLVPMLSRVTDNDLVLDWFWGGIMGDDEDYIAKMRIDQLQGAGFSGAGMVMACPEIAVLELPFLFNNSKEVDYVIKKMRGQFENFAVKNGFRLLFLIEQDFDQLYSVTSELRTPADFKESKFLTWYGMLEEEVLKRLGANPIPVNVPEVASNIRSGVCDAFISPAIWTVGSQLYTKLKYVNPVKIRFSPGGGVITVKAWNALPEKYQLGITSIQSEIEDIINQNGRKANKDCLNAMIAYGLKEVKMTPAEIEVLKKRCIPLWDEFAGRAFPKKSLDELLKHLSEYRSKNDI